ncbi:MAG TPA: FliM/FliN family flagellar motor switch protein, partial [Verrucomicrobiae bacterium]
PADAPVELSVNGKLIARGEVVVIEDRYGVKITEVLGNLAVA